MALSVIGCSEGSRPKPDDASGLADSSQTSATQIFNSVDSAIAFQKTAPVFALDLSRQQLTSLPPDITELDSLIYLDLSVNQFETVPREILELASLRELDLSNNLLKTLPGEMKSLVHLKALHLRYNRFDEVPAVVVHLAQSGRLEFLDLEGNELPKEKIQALQKAFQNSN